MPIEFLLHLRMAERRMKVSHLAEKLGMAPTNVSAMKNSAKGIRFSTLEQLCEELDCQPGDLFRYVPKQERKPTP